MRYYRIEIAGKLAFTSHPNGVHCPPDPGALLVEFDIFVLNASAPVGGTGTAVRVWGIPLPFISETNNLNGRAIKIYGGMGCGLPLANADQSGLLVSGTIQQAFANWIGTLMTLDLVIMPGGTTPPDNPDGGSGAPASIVVNWKKGTTLASALQATLHNAFPNFNLRISITPTLVLDNDEVHVCGTLVQLGTYVNALSQRLAGTNKSLGPWSPTYTVNAISQYQGVIITSDGTTISVTDGTNQAANTITVNAKTGNTGQPSPVPGQGSPPFGPPNNGTGSMQHPLMISYIDLIGQPTWIGPQQIQVTTVMRADLQTGYFIQLPPTRVTVTAPALTGGGAIGTASSPFVSNINFNGIYMVQDCHHLGNYKDPTALAWVSIFNCTVASPGPATPIPSGKVKIGDIDIKPKSK
jgi:hypothetical protein